MIFGFNHIGWGKPIKLCCQFILVYRKRLFSKKKLWAYLSELEIGQKKREYDWKPTLFKTASYFKSIMEKYISNSLQFMIIVFIIRNIKISFAGNNAVVLTSIFSLSTEQVATMLVIQFPPRLEWYRSYCMIRGHSLLIDNNKMRLRGTRDAKSLDITL